MGQYYIGVSLDAKEYVSPFGAKLMEHSWINNGYLKLVEQLLSPGNKWHKTRIVWAGDYMDDDVFLEGEHEDTTLYGVAHNEWQLADTSRLDGPEVKYVVNHTKNMYFALEDVPPVEDNPDWKIHPLSILCSSGNGRGGGDYRDDEDKNVGSWAGDVISTEYVEPDNMEKFVNFFTDD